MVLERGMDKFRQKECERVKEERMGVTMKAHAACRFVDNVDNNGEIFDGGKQKATKRQNDEETMEMADKERKKVSAARRGTSVVVVVVTLSLPRLYHRYGFPLLPPIFSRT